MSTKLILKKSTVGGKIPTAGDLEYGELALNYADGKLYYKDNTDTIRSFVDSDILLAYLTEVTDSLQNDLMDSQEVANLIDSTYLLAKGYNSGSFDIDFLTKTTDSLMEGTINQYYLSTRVDSDIDARVTKSFVDALGADAATLNSQLPSYYLDWNNFTNTPNVFDSAETRSLFAAGNGLEYDSSTGTFSVPIGGLVYTTVDFDSDFTTKTTTDLAEGTNLYYTTARANTDFDTRIATKSTSDVAEGSNLYYTTARADSDFDARLAIKSTTNLSEGNNLYYTTLRADSDFDARLSIKTTTNLAEGTNLYYTDGRFDTRLATKSTTDIAEGNNLYYTTGRANTDFDTRLATKSTTDVAEGTNLYYTDGRFDTRLATKSTTDVAEGTNLYYTTARADSDFDARLSTKTTDDITEGTDLYYTDTRSRAAISVVDAGGDGSLFYSSTSGVFTYTGPSAAEARAHFSAAGDLSYNSGTGEFSVTTYKSTDFDTDFAGKSTTDLSEGTNLYYTAARVDSDFDARLATKSTTDVAEGTNLYYTTARADSDAKNAVSVTDAGGDGSLTYNSATGEITYTGPSASEVRAHFSGGTGVDITSGVVSVGQPVGTTDDVTFGKLTADSAEVGVVGLVSQAIPMSQAGALYWDSDPQKGLSFIPTTNEGSTDVTINIGQELLIYVHNQTGETIANGDVVQVIGTAHGAHPLVAKAQSNTAINGQIAVATQDIVDNAHGYVTRLGLVRDVNTGGLTAGANVYVSLDSAGQWTTTEVSIDNGYPYHVGKVLAVDSSAGSILVDPFTEHFEYLRIQDRLKVDGPIQGTAISGSYLDLDGSAPAHLEGRLFYDSANGALAVYNQIADITMQVGQEQWVKCYNNSGATIPNGKAVYVASSHGGTPAIALADATSENTAYALGLATHDIPNGTYGYVTQSGVVNGIDTSAFAPGQRLHISTTPGGLQVAAPNYPAYSVEIGEVLLSDSSNGRILVDRQSHTFESIRAIGDGRIDGNLTVGGNLNVVGTTTQAITQSLTVTSNIVKLLDGDTLGTAYQSVGGLDDATFRGNYTGDSDLFYFIRMVSVDSSGDVIEFGISDSDLIADGQYGVPFDSAGGPTTWNLLTNGLSAPLRNGISIDFINATGHADSDVWCAHPTELNLDLGLIGNYNPAGPGGLRYTGVYRDAADSRWKFFEGSTQPFGDPNTTQFEVQDSAGVGYTLSDVQANTFYGALSGNATSANTATILQTSRSFSLSGEVTTTSPQTFNGSANVVLPVIVADNVIDNANIKAAAGIVDSKLATISTAGKVQNSATTATSANTGSAIVARDASGNFSAGTITAALSGNASTASTLQTARTIAISGDITGTATSFNGGSDISISSAITAGAIVNADINASAAIADTKLATISTAGKVSNSATTATSANTASAIVARDGSGNFSAGTITAALSGNASTATKLATARTIAISGDITGTATSFDGSGNISISSAITAGSIVNADINASAAIADTKLATISTAGKVANSATTATNANTASAIVARDASGNFSAGTITASLSGNASTASTLQTARTIAITGDITGTATSFNGGSNISISSAITAGSIVNADINASAAIADTKLATISTSGKVANSATTATSSNVDNAIVARDIAGNFTAGTITATLAGNAATASTLQTARTIAISGDITGTATSFNGGSNISISSAITAGAIVNADINASAGIVDTKLATISTAGKVSNSATTATSANTVNAIVARDASGNFSAGTITASLSGNASTATTLQTARTIALSGDITGTATSFNGGSNISISTAITAGSIVNADISASAAIADTKLGTISTAGKVSNSATTATSANTANAIVARDASGNFSAGTITASLNGNANTATSATNATNATNADTVDSLHAASFLRSDADDTFTGKLAVGSTTIRGAGMYGTYDSTKTGHVWSMGTAYAIPNDGSTFGTLYGMAYKHTNNPTGGTMAGGHQIVVCSNGTPGVSLGMAGNVWTSGQFLGTATSALWADLAERYHADAEYGVGTVLGIGGDNEVTLYQPGMPLAGVVSTEPGFRMNDGEDKREDPLWPFVALKGRIPVKISGQARKGQYIIAHEDGLGRAVDYSSLINNLEVIGIALEDGIDMVEVKV